MPPSPYTNPAMERTWVSGTPGASAVSMDFSISSEIWYLGLDCAQRGAERAPETPAQAAAWETLCY